MENFLIEVDWLSKKLHLSSVPKPAVKLDIEFTLYFAGSSVRGLKMAYSMADDATVGFVIRAVDAKGNPASLDGVPEWAVSDDDLLAVTPAADGLSASVSAVGPLGTAQVQVTADARMGPEVLEITGSLDITIVAGEAVMISLEPVPAP